MKNPVTTLAFIALTLGGGMLVGLMFKPGSWYAALEKPIFNPPNWVFAPAWTVLYILIGLAGARVFIHPAPSAARTLWSALLALNFIWTPVFFGLHWPGVALSILTLMLTGIITFILLCWSRNRTASWLFVPYAAWIAYAFALNTAIVVLNP
jgi:tryptophan-rich sensory protein